MGKLTMISLGVSFTSSGSEGSVETFHMYRGFRGLVKKATKNRRECWFKFFCTHSSRWSSDPQILPPPPAPIVEIHKPHLHVYGATGLGSTHTHWAKRRAASCWVMTSSATIRWAAGVQMSVCRSDIIAVRICWYPWLATKKSWQNWASIQSILLV